MNRVLLGMSGGTDSTVSAILLKKLGYEVTGITFRFYEINDQQEYLSDAMVVCNQIGIRHIVLDARSLFEETIIKYFINEYLSGRTPVPCVICNRQMKWPLLAQIADQMGIHHISTGHYACLETFNDEIYFTSGKDPDKDQSFFLWGLGQDLMRRIILPLGNLTKTEVRRIAVEYGLQKTATKKDSTGICFCPDDYRSFLKKKAPAGSISSGFFYDTKGHVLGKHRGYPFYTIGQRRGLDLQLNKPVFVKEIHPLTNRIILDDLSGLYYNQMIVNNFNWVSKKRILSGNPVTCKIRYRKQATPSLVTQMNDNELLVDFLEPLESIAPGQAAAFYDGKYLLGGGIIHRSLLPKIPSSKSL